MLNSTEHEIYPAHTWMFVLFDSLHPSQYFFLLCGDGSSWEGFYSRMPACGTHAIFFPDHTQILTRCKTVPHPKFVKEMPETRAYPLNDVNTHIFNENETIFQCLG